jgi:hypothetical protein
MRLTGKTREELAAALEDKSRAELLELIFSLVNFERLLSAGEVARASRVSVRDVLADMKAGKFVDPVFGAGFFCRGSNSRRVSMSAANAWRARFFVRVVCQPADSLPPIKKGEQSTFRGHPERWCETPSAYGNRCERGKSRANSASGFGLSVELAKD